MGRARRVVSGRSGSVHNKEWTVACIVPTNLDLAVGSLVVFSMFVADEAETVLRSRGDFMAQLNPGAIDEAAVVAAGLAIVSARAVAAGAASVPRPATEGSYPWLWHGFFNVSSAGGAIGQGNGHADRIVIDSKAMRKVKETEVMVLAFEICSSVDAGGVVQLLGGLRVLTGD